MKNDTVIRPTRKRFIITVCLFIGIFVAYLDRVNVSVLAANEPFLIEMGIQGESLQIGMMMTAFLIAYGIANIVLAPLGDYLGPRKSMILCILIWTIALLIGGFATSFALIIICRIVLGIGEGFYYPLQSTFIKSWFPIKERGRANSSWIIGQSIAPAVAMPFFAYWIDNFGWRSNFFFCAVIGLIPLYFLFFHTADKPHQFKGINSLELEYIKSGQEVETISTSDSFWNRIRPVLTNSAYWLLVLWYACLLCMYWGLITWLPSYLKEARAFSWVQMGWLASLPFVLSIFSKAITGVLVDKFGRAAPILMVAMSSAAVCIYLGAFVENKYLSAVFLSLSVAFCTMGTPVAWTLLQNLISSHSVSAAGGTMSGIGNGLSSLSPAFIGIFIAMKGDYTGGLLCLVVTGVVATIAALILAIKRY